MSGTHPTEPFEEPYEISGLPTPKDERRKHLSKGSPLVKGGPHFWTVHMGLQSKFLWVYHTAVSEKLWDRRQEVHGRVLTPPGSIHLNLTKHLSLRGEAENMQSGMQKVSNTKPLSTVWRTSAQTQFLQDIINSLIQSIINPFNKH